MNIQVREPVCFPVQYFKRNNMKMHLILQQKWKEIFSTAFVYQINQ